MIHNKYILQFVGAIYILFFASLLLPITQFGIVPRTAKGIAGIFLAPFFHGSFRHLISNTVPLIVLLFILNTFYPKKAVSVVVFSALAGGFLVWLLGRSANHIGASGLIYGLAAFLMANGFIEKKMVPLMISVGVILLYGGMVWGVFPSVNRYISWEGHLFGAIAGVLAAYLLKGSTNA